MTHKQVIVVRKDLNMRKGKMISQGAHASLGAILSQADRSLHNRLIIDLSDERIGAWLKGMFTKVCVSVDSEMDLKEIYEQAKEAGLICTIIKDAGLTEFGGVPTYTTVAIGPDLKEKVDAITGKLSLL